MTWNDVTVWMSIRSAKKDFDLTDHPPYESSTIGFQKWLHDTWGITVTLSDDGYLSPLYQIVSEEKYVMFVLRYQ